MSTIWLAGRTLIAALLTLGLVVGSSPTQATPLGQADGGTVSTTAINDAALALREGWDLLLDRYVEPLDPVELAQAADRALRARLESTGAMPTAQPLAIGPDRAATWGALLQRYRELARGHPEIAPSDLVHAALAAMAAVPGEDHTRFLTPTGYQAHLAAERGESRYVGVGFRTRGQPPTIVEVFPGSPAAEAGLRPGDRITQVDDPSTLFAAGDRASGFASEEPARPVTFTVARAGTGALQRFTLTPTEILVPNVESHLHGRIGYIRLRRFADLAAVDAVDQALRSLQAEGALGIILDLRGNRGGQAAMGTSLLRRFIAEGPVYQQFDGRGTHLTQYVYRGSLTVSLSLALLVDESSASMAEIVAAAVQEHRAGRLFGVTTQGSVASSEIVPLSDGAALQVTVRRVLSGQGRLLDGVGVTPDEVVALDLEELHRGQDLQIERAAAYLRSVAGTRD